MNFKRGDSAVYPGCGVGIVREIEKIDLGEGTTEMYVIQFPEDGTKVWVPTIAAQEQGMRKVMTAKKVEEMVKGKDLSAVFDKWGKKHKAFGAATARCAEAVNAAMDAATAPKTASKAKTELF